MNKLNFKANIVQLIACISTLLINLMGYFFLPAMVGIQVNASGVSNTAPKLLYLCVSFLVITLLSYLGTKPIGSKKNQYTMVAIFLAVANAVTIILNIMFLT